jgi:hypothetical protein
VRGCAAHSCMFLCSLANALGFTEVSLMVSWCRLTLALEFTLALAWPHPANAQAAHGWSSDVNVGGAIVEGGRFYNIGKAAAHVSLADRVLQRGRVATYVEAAYDWLGRFGPLDANSDLTCIVDRQGGGCRPDYPNVIGPSASIGLLYGPSPRVETRVGMGGAAYSVDGTRVGAVVGNLDAAFFPAAHFGLILGARFAMIPRYRHDFLTTIPMLFGLRVR